MNFSKLAWIGLCTLTVGIIGCPGDDGSTDTSDTVSVPTTGPGTTTGNDTTGGETTETPTGGDDTTTTGSDDTSTGGVTCDPPCPDGEMCIQGTCLEVGDSSGDPPPMCDVAPLDFGNPECNTCLQGSCCAEMMGCFGDSTQLEPTACLNLNNCIAMNCQMAMDLPSLQMCIDMNCAENADQLNTWLGFNQCAAMSCAADCQ